MNKQLQDHFLSRKGQIVTLSTSKSLKLRKGINHTLIKKSKFQARAGVDYEHIKEIAEKRNSGELPKENAGLPYGEWYIFPYIIKHNGKLYYRFSSLNGGNKGSVQYLLDGKEVTEEEARKIALASEFKKSSPVVFNLAEENIKEIK